jgi:hypothetical protein
MRSDTPTARWPDPRRLVAGLDRADAAEDLLDFVRLTWRAIEATRPLVEGWVLGAMCEHLTAVSDGEIPRLLINAPPGFMKSLLVDVLWPAWEWGPRNRPEMRYLCCSYSEELTKRDNARFRNLITSPTYRALWATSSVPATSSAGARSRTTARAGNSLPRSAAANAATG